MNIARSIKGHRFGVTFYRVEPLGTLENGVTEYEACILFYRDGRFIGSARWDGQAIEPGGPRMMLDRDDSAAVLSTFEQATREHFAAIGATT